MPYIKSPRPYKKEYENYHSKPEQKKNRAKRNAARRTLEKEGLVKKGDGKDVHHKKALSKGGGNGRSNLSPSSVKKNRGYKRNADNSVK